MHYVFIGKCLVSSMAIFVWSTWYSALVGLVSRVSPDVLLEMWELGELALTYFTSVGLDAKVDPHVLGEVGAVGEWFTAVAALVRFRLSHVDLGVELQVGFWSKNLGERVSWDQLGIIGGEAGVQQYCNSTILPVILNTAILREILQYYNASRNTTQTG